MWSTYQPSLNIVNIDKHQCEHWITLKLRDNSSIPDDGSPPPPRKWEKSGGSRINGFVAHVCNYGNINIDITLNVHNSMEVDISNLKYIINWILCIIKYMLLVRVLLLKFTIFLCLSTYPKMSKLHPYPSQPPHNRIPPRHCCQGCSWTHQITRLPSPLH